jgi:hypothetical protein
MRCNRKRKKKSAGRDEPTALSMAVALQHGRINQMNRPHPLSSAPRPRLEKERPSARSRHNLERTFPPLRNSTNRQGPRGPCGGKADSSRGRELFGDGWAASCRRYS